jgi:hypothetical protein
MSPVVIKPGSHKGAGSTSVTGREREDTFHLSQAFRDWLQILFAPGAFFQSEEGEAGLQSPFAMLCAYALVFGIATALLLLISDAAHYRFDMLSLLAAFLPAAALVTSYGMLMAVWSLPLHGVSRLCGGTGEFSGTFRAVVYAFVPYATLGPLITVFLLVQHPLFSFRTLGSDPILLAGNSVGFLWAIPLQVMGLRATQNMSTGGAIVATLVSAITMALIVTGLYVVTALSPLLPGH